MKLNWEQDPLHPSCHEVQNHCNRRYEEIDRPVQDNEMEEVTSGRIATLGTWATSLWASANLSLWGLGPLKNLGHRELRQHVTLGVGTAAI